jgi:hypothetical protein
LLKPLAAMVTAARSAVNARAPAVPRIAATLARVNPSVKPIVRIVIAVASTTATGTGGTPWIRSGTRILMTIAIVRAKARRARRPRQPPATTTARANTRTSQPSWGSRQRSWTATKLGLPSPVWVKVTTTSSPTR